MSLGVEFAWVVAVLLFGLRMFWFFFSGPMGLLGYLPTRVRLYIVLVLSAVIVSASGATLSMYPQGVLVLFIMAAYEMVLGLTLALGLYLMVAVFSIGGRILDFQSGFASANLFNPATNNQDPLFGTVFSLVFVMWFYFVGGHHHLIQMMKFSIEVFPIGAPFELLSIGKIVEHLGAMMSLAMVLIAPIIALLFLVDTAIAAASRSMPQMNVYFLFLPLKLMISLVFTGLAVRYLDGFLQAVFDKLINYWTFVLNN